MKPWPLRLKVTLRAALLGASVLLVLALLISWRVQHAASAAIDRALSAEVDEIISGIWQGEGPVEWSNPQKVSKALWMLKSDRFLQIESPPGVVVYRRQAFDLPAGKPGLPYDASGGGTRLRLLQGAKDNLLIRLAASSRSVDEAVGAVWSTFALAGPLILAGIWFASWWLANTVLRPVEELAHAASEIDARSSERKIPSPGTNDEIGHLTDVLNEMFSRIRQSFAQARQFSADASHELKTPLTIIRGEVEAALRADNLSPATEKTMLDLLEETGRLINIVEGLLLLSQADAGKLQFDLRPVNLSTVLGDMVEDVEILAGPHEITVRTDFDSNVLVEGNAQFLRQVLLNLFDNAIKYNTMNGQVIAHLTILNGMAVFTISNTGAPIPEEDRERIFDRFHRADHARVRTRGGHGLGLSICREIVRAHGGDITLEPSSEGWIKFRLTLPSRNLTQSGVLSAQKEHSEEPITPKRSRAIVMRDIQ